MFAEPIAATNFSFLTGASHPGEMVEQAIALGMAGIGIADRNSVAGVVRAHSHSAQVFDMVAMARECGTVVSAVTNTIWKTLVPTTTLVGTPSR